MDPRVPRQLTIRWEVTLVELTPDDRMAPVCQKCHAFLEVHQPDEGDPEHLLATCHSCGAWHLLELPPNTSEAYLFHMPFVEYIREHLDEIRTQIRPRRPPGRSRRAIADGKSNHRAP